MMTSLARLENDLRVALHKKNTQAAEAIIKEAFEGSTYCSISDGIMLHRSFYKEMLRRKIPDDILLTLLQHGEDPKFILKMVACYIWPHADHITHRSMDWLTERQFDNDGKFLDIIIPVIGFKYDLDRILRKVPISEENFLSLLKMNCASAPALACAAVFSRHPSNVNLAHVVLKTFPEERDDILVQLRVEMKACLTHRDYYHRGIKRPLGLSSAAEQFCRVVLGEVIDRTSFLEMHPKK